MKQKEKEKSNLGYMDDAKVAYMDDAARSSSGASDEEPALAPSEPEEDTFNEVSEEKFYRVITEQGVYARKEPSLDAEKTEDVIQYYTTFRALSTVEKEGRLWHQLKDGGWVFSWGETQQGQKVKVLEAVKKFYTVNFPAGVYGITWGSDASMTNCKVAKIQADHEYDIRSSGIEVGDMLVSLDDQLVAGMNLGQVLERIWASNGNQPGLGKYYQVVTKGPYGIGIRKKPFVDAERTGEDLLRGTVFEVDEVLARPGDFTYLHLADNRGWVFDTSPLDAGNPSVQAVEDKEPGANLGFWRGTQEELSEYLGLQLKHGVQGGHTLTVIEDGKVHQHVVDNGTNLRQALVDRGYQIYQSSSTVFNCNSRQFCGTCVVDVVQGNENLTISSLNEKRAMASNPEGYRLSCNIDIYGDVMVRLRPSDVIYNGGTR